jgi:DNA mismatch endonuclease (patch repair protein)
MKAIRDKNTTPERTVRSMLHRSGFRFRLHRRDLPGRPDIVLPKHRTVVMVNGCFWHSHSCSAGHLPKSREDYWKPKLARTVERDRVNHAALQAAGWQVLVVWECELKDPSRLESRLRRHLAAPVRIELGRTHVPRSPRA